MAVCICSGDWEIHAEMKAVILDLVSASVVVVGLLRWEDVMHAFMRASSAASRGLFGPYSV
jgi:hypothetical protein